MMFASPRCRCFGLAAYVALSKRMPFPASMGAGLAILIGFHCYLRPGEIRRLTLADISIPARCDQGYVVARDPKSGKRYQSNEVVSLRDEFIARLYRACAKLLKPAAPLVSLNESSFNLLFNQALADLGLEKFGFSQRSIRRGGASFDCQQCLSYDAVCQRGR